jgi:hypothetical protein
MEARKSTVNADSAFIKRWLKREAVLRHAGARGANPE